MHGAEQSYLVVVAQQAGRDDLPVLLLGLHGFGSDETQVEPLLSLELESPFVYLAPRGWYTLTDGGYAWFPIEQTEGGFKVNRTQHLDSMALLESFTRAATKQYRSRQVYLDGYSQGAGPSLSYYLHKSKTLAGAVALSGTLLQGMRPEKCRREQFKDKPLFIGQGSLNPLVSATEQQALKTYLNTLDAPLSYNNYSLPHVVSQAAKEDVQLWLERHVSG